jgi:hypothetical protein
MIQNGKMGTKIKIKNKKIEGKKRCRFSSMHRGKETEQNEFIVR